jgi:hypothetical protein
MGNIYSENNKVKDYIEIEESGWFNFKKEGGEY